MCGQGFVPRGEGRELDPGTRPRSLSWPRCAAVTLRFPPVADTLFQLKVRLLAALCLPSATCLRCRRASDGVQLTGRHLGTVPPADSRRPGHGRRPCADPPSRWRTGRPGSSAGAGGCGERELLSRVCPSRLPLAMQEAGADVWESRGALGASGSRRGSAPGDRRLGAATASVAGWERQLWLCSSQPSALSHRSPALTRCFLRSSQQSSWRSSLRKLRRTLRPSKPKSKRWVGAGPRPRLRQLPTLIPAVLCQGLREGAGSSE